MALIPRTVGPSSAPLLDHARPRRACIVLLSGIGDVVHGLPLATDIRTVAPDVEVVWVAEPAPAEVLRHHPAVDRVVVYRTRGGPSAVRALRRDLADTPAGLCLNVQRYFKSVWPTLLSRAPLRVGLPPSKTRDGIRFIHTHVLAEGPWKHTQALFLDFRRVLGVDRDAPVVWDIRFSEEERREQAAFRGGLTGRRVASLVVASANPKKDWPAERTALLADALAEDYGFEVLLLGGPSPRERRMAQEVVQRARTRPRDCLGDSVRRLMWMVDASDLVVAPDTGPLHIAHALGVPVIGLFGHTNPWRVGPYRRFHDLIVDRYTEPGDEPDPSAYLPRDGRMEAVTVEDVLLRVDVAVRRYLSSSPS